MIICKELFNRFFTCTRFINNCNLDVQYIHLYIWHYVSLNIFDLLIDSYYIFHMSSE